MTKNKPSIKYRKVIINKRNVDAYRSGRTHMFRGEFNYETNVITIFRYTINKSLSLDAHNDLYTIIKANKSLEPKTLIHELKHFENIKYGLQESLVKNYYELCGLFAFDEVSAFAAENLIDPAPTLSQVREAVSCGIDDFLYQKDIYIPDFMQTINNSLFSKNSDKDTVAIVRHIRQNLNPPKHYSATFIKTINKYLTFNNQGIRDSNNRISNKLQNKIQNLILTYENATTKHLQKNLTKLAQH